MDLFLLSKFLAIQFQNYYCYYYHEQDKIHVQDKDKNKAGYNTNMIRVYILTKISDNELNNSRVDREPVRATGFEDKKEQ